MTKHRKPYNTTLACLAGLWILAIPAGAWLMLDHEFDAGAPVDAPDRVPEALAALAADAAPVTIFMAVHPGCPCTRASIEQLDRLAARAPRSLEIVALFRPDASQSDPASLRENAYWRRIAKLPGARPVLDPDGALARQLGAEVSGWAVAYDASGALRFQGGLTPSRGHSGSSLALDQLEALARGLPTAPELCEAPAFGCALESEDPKDA